MLRVFLMDGTSLSSYGEVARVGDRVVFSMPTAATPNPPLQLVDIHSNRVDWDRTDRYAASARASHYLETQADIDFGLLSNEIAQALSDVTAATDPKKRLEVAEQARRALVDWPQSHYNYRLAEVRQMVSLLDEAIADLRTATGQRFNLSLVSLAAPPSVTEPLLPPLTPQETIEQALVAARVVDTAPERTLLLSTALASIDRDEAALPAEWAASARADAKAEIETERMIDRSYQSLTRRMMALATTRARVADVRGLERVIARIQHGDTALGGKRPEALSSLLDAVQARLAAARQYRLAWDRWMLRASVLRRYRIAIQPQLNLLAGLRAPLESIKSLSGTPPSALGIIQTTVDEIMEGVSAIAPPDELKGAHALLVSAVQLAGSAGQIRRQATLAGDVTRAWDASSAAAGALMLGSRARADIRTLLRAPQLR